MRPQLGKIIFGSRRGDYAGTGGSQPFGTSASDTAPGACYKGDLSIKYR